MKNWIRELIVLGALWILTLWVCIALHLELGYEQAQYYQAGAAFTVLIISFLWAIIRFTEGFEPKPPITLPPPAPPLEPPKEALPALPESRRRAALMDEEHDEIGTAGLMDEEDERL